MSADDLARLNAETDMLLAQARKLRAEQSKFEAERSKFEAERDKLRRERELAPWQLVVGSVIASVAAIATVIGATVALIKLL